jgi:carboxymethylenebutenolidase
MQVPGLSAGICYYGLPADDDGDPRSLRLPLQGHFAQKDTFITPERVDRLEQQLREGGAPHEFYRYDADHAFANETRPDRHDPEAAALAWRRSLEFLARHVG